jgi:hypothetical protein
MNSEPPSIQIAVSRNGVSAVSLLREPPRGEEAMAKADPNGAPFSRLGHSWNRILR